MLDSEYILEEWLYVYPNGRKQAWFVRSSDDPKPFKFSKLLLGENRIIQSITRRNSLFLSAAAQNNHEQLLPVYRALSTGVAFSAPRDRTLNSESVRGIRRAMEEPVVQSIILDLLALADLGIVGVDIDHSHPQSEQIGRIIADRVFGVFPPLFKLRHRAVGIDGGLSIPLHEESAGTQALLSLSIALVVTLGTGGIMCVDELDASLHPAVAREIVRMFHDSSTNPHGAQLIFNTHDTNLLDSQVEGARLRRDQIWFTEKDDAGATHLYPLTDFKPRTDENLERGYLQGRYGAIPVVGSLSFFRDAADDGEGSE